jgi:hypothetical protein
MRPEIVMFLCVLMMAVTVMVIDFNAANDRWCAVYPEMCFEELNEVNK